MLGASTVSKSTVRGVIYCARQRTREITFNETYGFSRLMENPIFEIVAYSRRVEELEAKFVHTLRHNFMIPRGSYNNDIK